MINPKPNSFISSSIIFQVTIGRGQDVDCDLTKEINSSRIHRRQAEIYVKDVNGMKSFSIKNIGHRVVFVNGNQLLMDDQIDLSHQRNIGF